MNYFSLIIIVIVFGGMMFFMNRQQKKQQAKRQETLNQMAPGSKIVTIGGLHGVLSSINEADNTIDIDCEGVILTFDRAAVKSVKPATEAVSSSEVVTSPIVDEKSADQ